MNKYRAKPVYFSYALNRQLLPNEIGIYQFRHTRLSDSVRLGEVIRFDSQLEFKVFQALVSSPLVSTVSTHHPIQVLPVRQSRCYPQGKKWKVDFLAKGQHKELLMLVEAKGLITKDFPFTLFNLEREQPKLFEKLWLVFERIPSSNQLIKNLQNTVDNYPKIVTLSQFKRLIA